MIFLRFGTELYYRQKDLYLYIELISQAQLLTLASFWRSLPRISIMIRYYVRNLGIPYEYLYQIHSLVVAFGAYVLPELS